MAQRVLLGGRALWSYVGKFLWPAGTCFFYPRWELDTTSFGQWTYPLTACAALLLVLLARKRVSRGVIVGVLCFVGPLLPVLGFMNVYGMRFAPVADRWVHFSTLPMAALVAAGALRLHRRWRPAFYGTIGIGLPALAILTWQHAGELRNLDTYWHSVLSRNPRCWLALNELGVQKVKAGQLEEAIPFFLQSIEEKSDNENAHGNLGGVYFKQDRMAEAIAELRIAARIEPHVALRHFHLGNALYRGQQMAEAAEEYRRALELQPSYLVHEELANTLVQLGRLDDACSHYREMQRLQADSAEPCIYLGNIHLQRGKFREGVEEFELALQRDPTNQTALNNLSLSLSGAPDASVRNATRAITLARRLDQLSGGKDTTFLATLAAACAEGRLFDEAADVAEKAAHIASEDGHEFLASSLHQRAVAYRDRVSN
jgi:tetratricopeptide (TPR) repeat protein